jgi:hypothetical protein
MLIVLKINNISNNRNYWTVYTNKNTKIIGITIKIPKLKIKGTNIEKYKIRY